MQSTRQPGINEQQPAGFATGVGYVKAGFRIIRRRGLRLYVWTPIFINLVVFCLLGWAAVVYTDQFFQWLMGFVPGWLDFLEWLLWVVFGLLILLVYSQTFVLVATLIGAPFYAVLAEKVALAETENRRSVLAGAHTPTVTSSSAHPLVRLLAVLPAALLRELRKMAYYLPRAMILLVISLIPAVNAISPLLWLLFSMWMLAVELIDYAVDNEGLPFGQVLALLKRRRVTAFGFGGAALAGTYVPLLNLFVLPAAVAGSVLFWLDHGAPARDAAGGALLGQADSV